MLKVMLLDDEDTNLELMKRIIEWETFGYCIAATANNGLEGLEVFQLVYPDVIIVDIRMPEMDGITFIYEIRKIAPHVKIVILSAYGEFEYAQKAIEQGIQAYLLKPIDENKLVAILKTIQHEHREETEWKQIAEEHDLRILQDHLEMNSSETGNETQLKKLGDKYNVKSYLVAFVRLNVPNSNENKIEAFSSAFVQSFDEIMNHTCFVFMKEPHEYFIVYYRSEDCSQGSFLNHFSLLVHRHQDLVSREISIEYTCGVSRVFASFLDLPEAYLQASQAYYNFFYANAAHIQMYSKEDGFGRISEEQFVSVKWKISEELYSGNTSFLMQYVEESFAVFVAKRIHPEDVYQLCHQLVVLLKQELLKIDNEAGLEFLINLNLYVIKKHNTISSLKNLIMAVAFQSGHWSKSKLTDKKNYAYIRKAKEYAMLHFQEENFNIENAAGYIGLTKNHFSKIYKEFTGENYWHYVIKLKMELAKKLLWETNKTNYEITCMIGYNSEYHFCRIFSKVVGMTTTQYRKMNVK